MHVCKNEHIELLDLIGNSQELDIFTAKSLQAYIKFKWHEYGQSHHIFGGIMHCIYVVMLIIYINLIYLHEHEENMHALYTILLGITIVYPWIYDTI